MIYKDAKLQVLERLVEFSSLIRRKGSPDEAAAVLPYEQQLQQDLQKRKAELEQPEPATA